MNHGHVLLQGDDDSLHEQAQAIVLLAALADETTPDPEEQEQ